MDAEDLANREKLWEAADHIARIKPELREKLAHLFLECMYADWREMTDTLFGDIAMARAGISSQRAATVAHETLEGAGDTTSDERWLLTAMGLAIAYGAILNVMRNHLHNGSPNEQRFLELLALLASPDTYTEPPPTGGSMQ